MLIQLIKFNSCGYNACVYIAVWHCVNTPRMASVPRLYRYVHAVNVVGGEPLQVARPNCCHSYRNSLALKSIQGSEARVRKASTRLPVYQYSISELKALWPFLVVTFKRRGSGGPLSSERRSARKPRFSQICPSEETLRNGGH